MTSNRQTQARLLGRLLTTGTALMALSASAMAQDVLTPDFSASSLASPSLASRHLAAQLPAPLTATQAATQAADSTIIVNAAPLPYALVAGQAQAPTKAVAQNLPLAPRDAELYQAAFAMIKAGDFDDADARLAQVKDQRLMGYATFSKLFHRKYTSTYDELMAWLDTYGDQPMAMRVWGLAKRKKPDGAPDPAFPSLLGAVPAGEVASAASTAVRLSGTGLLNAAPQTTHNPGAPAGEDLTPKSARSAYNNGQLEQAARLGKQIGDHWVTGLANWRLGRYDQALAAFRFVATDPSQNAWSQSGGSYWAGRAALKLGKADEAEGYFKIAASFPFTFYGLVAEQRLGVTPAVVLSKKGELPTFSGQSRTAMAAVLEGDFGWAQSHSKAQRMNALIQVGRFEDAQDELQAAVQSATTGEERDRWLALSARTQIPVSQLKRTDKLFDASLYPMPDFAPAGGYKVPKALVFALARKESKFNPKAYSYSGAYGLLQLMPATAALVENDASFTAKPKQLLTPEINLRVGQNYITRLFDSKVIDGDLLRTLAAYNAGPRPVKDAMDSLGPDADALLFLESIPVAQTRQYVEEVAANYWIYRQLMGQPTKTLTLAANDARIIDATADR
ncbi:lytic transglycosylase domain-containing protein [Asticcacaulis sp. AC402]|uniref:lytic transglycosylase domain-containing protein n=1 Tax=Asticcacaulis sp. AC402 TaxID=1282361 RepID=UPI0003C3BC62|nr:lytic transglycosylase domain-containing protein [Asticcacaulis sp. AC402]ESQ76421.1 lytic transglycosylase [Asticcacaulis sp. AC402]